LISNHIR